MGTVLLVIHLLVAIFLVGIILLQKSSGGALDGLGGGSGATSFLSARGKGNLLTKLTAIFAAMFILTSISLSIYHRGGQIRSKSILEARPAQQEAPAEPAAPLATE